MYKTARVTMLAMTIPEYLTLAARGHSRSNLPSAILRVMLGALHLSMSINRRLPVQYGPATSRTLS